MLEHTSESKIGLFQLCHVLATAKREKRRYKIIGHNSPFKSF